MKIMFGKYKKNNLMSGIEVAMKPDSAITFMSWREERTEAIWTTKVHFGTFDRKNGRNNSLAFKALLYFRSVLILHSYQELIHLLKFSKNLGFNEHIITYALDVKE